MTYNPKLARAYSLAVCQTIMTQSVAEKLGQGPMFDMAIVEHHFTPYMRDYDIIVDVTAAVPGEQRSYIEGRYRYRFSHCVLSEVTTAVRDENWADSWADVFLDFAAWEAADCPSGYVWGVCWMGAYPGLSYISDSPAARDWGERLGHLMHEVYVETNAHNISDTGRARHGTIVSGSRGEGMRMALLEEFVAEAPPLRRDEGGTVRVGQTRVTLDTVLHHFHAGRTPEQIVAKFDTLALDDVYGAIAYSLRHRAEVDAYLERRAREAEAVRRENERRSPPDPGL